MLAPGLIFIGSELTISASFQDADGVAVDPDTVTFKAMSPSGVQSSYVYQTDDEVERESAGNYNATVTPDEPGRWFYRWITTGTGKVIASEGNFLVQDSPFYSGLNRGYC